MNDARWLLVTLTALASGAAAQQETSPAADRAVAFEVGTGVQYDSNVAILELDTASNAGDAAALLELGIGFDNRPGSRIDLKAGYNFSQTTHDDFDEFDLRIHRGSTTVAYDFGSTDAGASFQHARAELDGAEFLTLRQLSPYVSRLLGSRLFLRFAYAYTDKAFAANAARDATSDSLSADAYLFLNGLTTYLVFGYRYENEDALDAQFDYGGHRLHAQLSRRFAVGPRTLTLKTELRYETRAYDELTPSIGVPRRDDRYQLEVTGDLPVTQRMQLRLGAKHADNRSNLPSVDFGENVYSVGLRVRL